MCIDASIQFFVSEKTDSSKTLLTPRIHVMLLGSRVLKPASCVCWLGLLPFARVDCLARKLHSGRVVEVLLFALAIIFAALGSGKDNKSKSLSSAPSPTARAK